MSSISRSGSSSLYIYPFEINTPVSKAKDSSLDEYWTQSNRNTPDISPSKLSVNSFSEYDDLQSSEKGIKNPSSDTFLKNHETLGPKNTTPSIPVSSINLMVKLRKLDPCISNHKPWIIRDFFLLFDKKDIRILLNTSKSFAYCILSDPVLKEKFTLLLPRDVNFDQQKKIYPINDFYQYLLEILLVKPKYQLLAVLQTKMHELYQKLTSPIKPVRILPPLDEPEGIFDPNEDSIFDPNEIVWTISELPLGARIASKAPFVRPISIPTKPNEKTQSSNPRTELNTRSTTITNRSLNNATVTSLALAPPIKLIGNKLVRTSHLSKPKETVWTISERPSGKRIKPAYVRPLALPPQKFTCTTNNKAPVDHVKVARRGFEGMRAQNKSSRDPTMGRAPYPLCRSNASHLKKALELFQQNNENAVKKD